MGIGFLAMWRHSEIDHRLEILIIPKTSYTVLDVLDL